MVNRLFASELEDVKTARFLDVVFEENIIYITMKYDSYVFDEETKYIAKYDVLTGVGNITDKKANIKEYTSLKRLYNACIKFAESFGCNLFFDYKKIESYKNNYVVSTEEDQTTEEIEIVKEDVEVSSVENNANNKQTYKEQLEIKIKDLKERLNNITISGNNLYDCILKHVDHGKTPDKQSYEYKELHKVLDKFEMMEDDLKADISRLSNELANICNANLKESYKAKYKVIYYDGTVVYSDSYNKNDLSVNRVSTLITNNGIWHHEVNVLEHNSNLIKVNEYKENALIKSTEYLQDRNTLINETVLRAKYNLTCYYSEITKEYTISFFTASIPLTIVAVDKHNNVRSYYWYGDTIVNSITKEAKEKIKTLHYKYRNDIDVKKYLDMVIDKF